MTTRYPHAILYLSLLRRRKMKEDEKNEDHPHQRGALPGNRRD